MIYIIDGPDGSGKTYLAKYIHDATHTPVKHYSVPHNITSEEMFEMYMHEINCNIDLIMDRSWFSEMVYGPIMRNGSLITYDQSIALEKALCNKGVLIFCSASIDTLWNRCTSRGEDYIQSKSILWKISGVFEDLATAKHEIPTFRYEYRNPSQDM